MSAQEIIQSNMTESIVIETMADDMALTQLDESDAPQLLALVMAGREHLREFIGVTAAEYDKREQFVDWIKDLKAMDILGFGIRDEGRLVGTITMTPDDLDGESYLGYWVGREHLGHKYGTKAVYMLMQYAFGNLGLSSLSAEVQVDNVHSAETLEAAGFEYWGQQYDSWHFKYLNPEKNYAIIKKQREVDDSYSVAEIELNGVLPMTVNDNSDTQLMVAEGEVVVEVDDLTIPYEQGEIITIPAKTATRTQTVGGPAILWALHTPPFNPLDQKIVKLKR